MPLIHKAIVGTSQIRGNCFNTMVAPSLSARTYNTVQEGTAQWHRCSVSADESGWDRSHTACLAAVG